MCREVPISHARVLCHCLTAARAGELDRLAGEALRLAVVRDIRGKEVPALFGHNVEHTALDVAEFRRRPKRIDVYLLDDVNVRLRLWTSGARAREVGAVQQIQVLVHAGTEDGDAGIGAARS